MPVRRREPRSLHSWDRSGTIQIELPKASVTPAAALPDWMGAWLPAGSRAAMTIFFTLSGFVIALSYSQWDWRADR